ncbi:MAG: hypothetical protein R6X12_09365 [bacterium]
MSDDSLRSWWPVILIVLGGLLLASMLSSRCNPRPREQFPPPESPRPT